MHSMFACILSNVTCLLCLASQLSNRRVPVASMVMPLLGAFLLLSSISSSVLLRVRVCALSTAVQVRPSAPYQRC
jgi:hypothetical protein